MLISGMPRHRHPFAPTSRLLLATLSCVLLSSCNPWSKRIHPDFAQTFVDVNRRGDDDAATVVFDPVLRMLAVGRESGRLELWDTTKTGSRIVRQAHSVRTGHIAFGREDGIILTSSVFDGSALDPDTKGIRIWDARTGEEVHALKGMWAPGPIAASPVRGLYLIADSGDLLLYDHTRRSFVGNSLTMEQHAQVTAIASDQVSGLIAIGTSNGDLLLMTLNTSGETPRLHMLRRTAPSPASARLDIHALVLLDDGKRLISAAATENGVFEWDTATLERGRQIPTSLNTVRWASYTAGERWLVLSGTESTRGRIELVDLNAGVAWRYKANTTAARAVLLPEINLGLILQSGGATQIKYLDQK
jgi:WD40 repeat protein